MNQEEEVITKLNELALEEAGLEETGLEEAGLEETGLEETITSQLKELGFTQELVTSLLNDNVVQDALKLMAAEKPMTIAELRQQQMEQYAIHRQTAMIVEEEVEGEDAALLPKREFDTKKYIQEEAVRVGEKMDAKKRSAQDAGLVEVKVLQEGPPEVSLEVLPINYEVLFENPNARVQKKIDKRLVYEKLTHSHELKMAFFEEDIDTVRVLLSLYEVDSFDWSNVIRDAGLNENVKLLRVLYDMGVLEPGPNREWREAFAGIPSVLTFFDTIKEEL